MIQLEAALAERIIEAAGDAQVLCRAVLGQRWQQLCQSSHDALFDVSQGQYDFWQTQPPSDNDA